MSVICDEPVLSSGRCEAREKDEAVTESKVWEDEREVP